VNSVALVGNPNVGKTTLFNALTGLNQHTGNYPGVTVEWKAGEWKIEGAKVEVVDLPGTYSLSAHSPDEAVVVASLLGEIASRPRPDAIIALVDASNPERNLYLLSQIFDLGLPVVVALNMTDVAENKGMKIDTRQLSKNLGVPVVAMRANKREGLEPLGAALLKALRERPAIPMPPMCKDPRVASTPELIRERYAWARRMLVDALERAPGPRETLSDRIDRVMTHKLWGSLIFLGLMALVFQSIFSWSQPLMDLAQNAVAALGALVLHPMSEGTLKSLLRDGVIAGAGSVIVFVPQIAALFFFIAILEDCGYMARSAFLMDKLFSRLGLSGRSFIPMLSSFACAVPGIMSTRTIDNPRERLVTMLVAPLMSCSARLPVYTIMIAAFVPATPIFGIFNGQGLTLLAMYLIGAATAIPVALILKNILMKNVSPMFLIELPPYKMPDARTVWRRVYHQCKAFVSGAGRMILMVAVVVWALSYFPRAAAMPSAAGVANAAPIPATPTEQLSQSFLGRAGRSLEPAFRPLGWDWRITVAALASFPAREVVVATLGTIFNLSVASDDDVRLRDRLKQATGADGKPLFNMAVAMSVMVFFALCMQCASTLSVIAKESGSWKWAAFAFSYMTVLAYAGAWLAYHGALLVMGA
jgi:ferrous iron transport protein B